VREWLRDRRGLDADADVSKWVESGSIIKDRGEFDAFPWPAPEDLGGYNDYDDLSAHLDALARALPGSMKVLAQLGYIFMGAWQLLGFENFCIKLADDPALIQDVFDRLGESQLAVLDILLSHDCVGTIWLPDDLCYNSGPMMSPVTYRKYVYPWYEKLVARCHQAEVPIGLHSDGDLSKLLPDLVACGFDCIHPFEPPMNDIVAIKREWGAQIALAGNVDLKKTLCGGRPEDVEAEVKYKIEALAPGGGWLLGSSNSIPDFVPLENYKALLAAGLRYGRYH
jgi:uroporphyrinogen decarboxylase